MKATELLHNLGQSLWLDNITRDLLDEALFFELALDDAVRSSHHPASPGVASRCTIY